MASHITYDGVPSVEGGNLFNGLRFWVSHRIPNRISVLKKIQLNGGAIVSKEQNATMKIADPARKDAPPGSHSFQFILDSVEHASLQVEDKYEIGPPPNVPRPAGSGTFARGSRVPFTLADDAVLAKWMLAHPVDQSGNKIFMELEQISSRHSWQSWRNRWGKNMKLKSQSDLQKLAALAPSVSCGTNTDKNPVVPASSIMTETRSDQSQESRVTETRLSHGKLPNATDEHAKALEGSNPSATEDDNTSDSRFRPRSSKTAKAAVTTIPESVASDDEEPANHHIAEDDENDENDDDEHGEQGYTPREQFYSDFQNYIDANGLVIRMVIKIDGRNLELWNLLQAVCSQNVPLLEVDWRRVTEDLGYDWRQNPQTPYRLLQCYNSRLADFMEAMASFAPDEPTEDAEETEQPSPPGFVPSSPPVPRNLHKRPLEVPLASSERLAKRARLSPSRTIPTTPDEKAGLTKPQANAESPSFHKSLAYDRQHADAEVTQELPPLQSRRQKTSGGGNHANQPSTPRRQLSQEDSNDITPSQQLQSEADFRSPIPIRLQPGSSHIPPSSTDESTRPTEKRKRALPSSFRKAPSPPSVQDRVDANQKSDTPVPTSSAPVARLRDQNSWGVRDWTEHYESLGYQNRTVQQAMRSTTMTPGGIAALVMQSLKDGKGIPSHHEGIWTERDDTSLRLVDSVDTDQRDTSPDGARLLRRAKREWDRIVHKHGLERIELRRRFLEAEAVVDKMGT